MNELKPCPFCGSDKLGFLKDLEPGSNGDFGFIKVYCKSCLAEAPSFFATKTAKNLLANLLWNTRV